MTFTHVTGALPDAAVADLAPDFASLEPSDYADGAYRLRRYSEFSFDRADGHVEHLPHARFVQSSDLNRFQGDVPRDYPDLLESTWRSPGFTEMFATFADHADLPEVAKIGVHQIRVVSKAPDDVAHTAPEGVHQDGFDRIGMFVIGRTNAVGAELFVHEALDAAPSVELHQEPGEYLVLDDRAFWHSARPLTAAAAGSDAYWDLFVLTADRS